MSDISTITKITRNAAKEAVKAYFSPILPGKDQIELFKPLHIGRKIDFVPIATEWQPDLKLFVRDEKSNGNSRLRFHLSTAERLGTSDRLETFDTVALRSDPQKFFSEMFTDFEMMTTRDRASDEVIERRIGATGSYLFESLLPQALRERLQYFADQGTTLQIESEDIWIPWEIFRLTSSKDGNWEVGPFLCETYAMTRWIPGLEARNTFPMRRIGVVAPQETRSAALAGAEEEAQFVASLSDSGHAVDLVSANYMDVTEAMSSGLYDGWHFAGHGIRQHRSSERWAIRLDHDEVLRPEDLFGTVRNFGRPHPLVFMNGCYTGRGESSLTDVGGWAIQFLDAGAGAFLGSYWAIQDEAATEFSESFYRTFLSGVPIGEAVRKARLALKASKPSDITRLAYTIFANPQAKHERDDE